MNGLHLSVAEHGRGGRPLLAVHGFTGAKEDFTEWLDPLADRGWHAASIDLRGHGMSDKPAGGEHYSLRQLAADVIGAADALGFERFVLIGHSMGGMVAQLVALEHKERLDGLVLMATGHGPVEGMDPDLIALAMSIVAESGMDGLAEALATLTSPLETEAHRRLKAEREGFAEYTDRNLRAVEPSAYEHLAMEMLGATDRLEALAEVELATLVIAGGLDHSFAAPCRKIAGAMPNATLAELPEAGHSPQFESPGPWWQALSGFLDDLV